jgi:hypothetical protein|tara:strand:+ start:334 stop:639 length:306 start_codon:yes stop_codon:yes gene_type:complete
MKENNSTLVEIKDKEVIVTRPEVKSNLDSLKEAIIMQLENSGFYFASCEPSLDVTDYNDEVTINLEKDEVSINSIIDNHFMKVVVRHLEHINNKEKCNEES